MTSTAFREVLRGALPNQAGLLAVPLFLLSSAGAMAQPVITGIGGVSPSQPAVAPFGFAVMEGENIADQDGNAEVTVNGVAALVAPEPGVTTAVAFQLPRGTAVGTAEFVVSVGGVASAPFSFPVSAFAPAIAGAGETYHADGSRVTSTSPIAPGERILVTGVTGLGAGDSPQVTVTIGGLPAQVNSVQDNVFEFFTPGVYTLDLTVPEGLAPGMYLGTLTVGGVTLEVPDIVIGTPDGQALPVISEITGVGMERGGVAPRGLASLFGSNIVGQDGNGEISVNGVAAVVLPERHPFGDIIFFQVPPETPVGTADVTVSVDGLVSAPFELFVSEFAPALTDDAAVLDIDQAVVNQENAADPGSNVFITGVTGLGAEESPQVSAAVGGLSAEVLSLRENAAQAAASQDGSTPVVSVHDAAPGVYTLEIRVPTALRPGPHALALTAGGATVSRDFFLSVAGEQQLPTITVVSAANFKRGLAAEMIVSGFTNALPNVFSPVDELPLPTEVEGAKVVVIDSAGTARDSQLFGVFNSEEINGQVNFLIPAGTAFGTAEIRLLVNDQLVANGTVSISDVAPGVFTANAAGTGVAAALFLRVTADGGREDGLIFDSNRQPIPLDLSGEGDQLFLQIFGTGMRGVSSAGAQQSTQFVSAEVNGVPTGVLAVAESPEFAGLDQVAIGPVDAERLSGKGEVDIELWFLGATTGRFTAAFGGDIIIPSPTITAVDPPGLPRGRITAVTLTGSGLLPVNRVEFDSVSGLTVTNVVGASTMATFDVTVGLNAPGGSRTLTVVTADGRSNSLDVTIVGPDPSDGGPAPTITEAAGGSAPIWAQAADFYLLSLNLGFQDADGDIIWRGDIDTSAKVEVRLTGTNGECVFIVGGPGNVNSGGSIGSLFLQAGMSGQAPVQPGPGMATITLIDAAQNRSNTLTTSALSEPAEGACDPNVPIVLLRNVFDFTTP